MGFAAHFYAMPVVVRCFIGPPVVSLQEKCWFAYFVAEMLVCVFCRSDVGLRTFSQRCWFA